MVRMSQADYSALLAKRGKGAGFCPPCTNGRHRQCERNGRPPKPCGCPRHSAKYHAERTVVDGITFHSKKEAARYGELRLMEKAGLIHSLGMQRTYHLIVNDYLICRYIADFVFTYAGRDRETVEDVKGLRRGQVYELFKLKAALMLACHGITVVEV